MLVLDDSFATSAQEQAPRMRMSAANPVPCWQEYIQFGPRMQRIEVQICVAPVLVCRIAKKTAGAGDNISASGLVAQLWGISRSYNNNHDNEHYVDAGKTA